MLFIAKPFTPIVLLSVLIVTGCHPKTPTSAEKSASTSRAVSAVASSAPVIATTTGKTVQNTVQETNTAQALLTVLSGLTVKTINENPKLHLTAEQKTCLIQTDNPEMLPKFQQYLQSKLTADDLTKTNQYYALPVGQKQIRLANQQLRAVKGEKIGGTKANEPVTLTDDEKLQIQAFQGTPEAKKLAALLSPQNQQDLATLTEPMATKVMADCQIKPPEIVELENIINSASRTATTKP